MTESYELLKRGPETGIHKADLSLEERRDIRRITVTGSGNTTRSNSGGRFVSVSYLAGDERAAATLFVEKNRTLLEQIDFSKTNSVRQSVPRAIYDWILHAFGRRRIEPGVYTVREDRPQENVCWILAKGKYENAPSRRYSVGGSGSSKLTGISPEQLYESLPAMCTLADLPEEAAGDVKWIFAYFDESPGFACGVTPTNRSIALRKESDIAYRGGARSSGQNDVGSP
ncbi:hypothetical protein SAMN04488063_2087 [Halopelagius inordinatus]|uniref:Uncharacterized protein n=1 Tax=Halopelagius inordinatus TaxID=553467 RepID=A0A1I2RWJ8_9EURY|nr:hypothetical protein [Halopelagius inordinatus]SFG45014.1 hypothetical protein SAMN04488063_2087 [Halopelagius inordinatus]